MGSLRVYQHTQAAIVFAHDYKHCSLSVVPNLPHKNQSCLNFAHIRDYRTHTPTRTTKNRSFALFQHPRRSLMLSALKAVRQPVRVPVTHPNAPFALYCHALESVLSWMVLKELHHLLFSITGVGRSCFEYETFAMSPTIAVSRFGCEISAVIHLTSCIKCRNYTRHQPD